MTDEKKADLTRLESLGHFEHQDDPETEDFFKTLKEKQLENRQNPPLPETPNEEAQDPFSSSETPILTEESAPETSEDSVPSFAEEIHESPFETNFEEAPAFEESPPAFAEETPVFETSSEIFSSEEIITEEPGNVEANKENELLNTMMEETFEPAQEAKEEPIQTPQEVITEEQIAPPVAIKEKPENFEELKTFANNISYGEVAAGGNPPFSILLKNINYEEDADDIFSLLREHGMILPENEETTKSSLKRGMLLVSHISEYSAIYLCHKLRKYSLDLSMGLSDEIHPPKIKEDQHRGLINKQGIKQINEEALKLDHSKLSLNKIIVTTTNLIEGHEIKRYLGMCSESIVLFQSDFNKEEIQDTKMGSMISSTLKRIRKVKDHSSMPSQTVEEKKPTTKEIYEALANKLKTHAFKAQGNAVVGVQYQLQPLVQDHFSEEIRYQLVCTGTIVWASPL